MASTAEILALPSSINWKTFTYIWMPIVEEKTPRSAWEIFFDNIKKKFENWETRWLNPVGQLVFIKSVLSALPLYQFSTLLALFGVVN